MIVRLATYDDVPAISTLFTEFFAYSATQQPENYVASKEDATIRVLLYKAIAATSWLRKRQVLLLALFMLKLIKHHHIHL